MPASQYKESKLASGFGDESVGELNERLALPSNQRQSNMKKETRVSRRAVKSHVLKRLGSKLKESDSVSAAQPQPRSMKERESRRKRKTTTESQGSGGRGQHIPGYQRF
jgi:hypothetical protein